MSSYTLPASPLGRSPRGARDSDPYRRSSMASAPYGSLGGSRGQPRSPLASSHHPARHVSGPARPFQTAETGESPPWAHAADTTGRRRSSVHSFTSAGQTPNFGSLVGSFQESLLRGRMSMPASKPVTFEAELGVLGLGRCRPSVRCPPHISLSFPAHFYNLGSSAASSTRADLDGLGSPYVGTIDLDSYYHDQLLSHQMSHLGLDTAPTDLPTFPGYAVPPKGRLQLVVKYPNMNAVKLFLVPYDLTDMPAGSKTFIRQKSVLIHPTDADCTPDKSPLRTRETLRFAIHLQFCSPPPVSKRPRHSEAGFESAHASTKPKKVVSPHIYLHKSIRVVFAARALESSDNLVESIETPGQGMDRFATYAGPDDDWTSLVKAAKAHASESDLPQNGIAGIDIPAPAPSTARGEMPSNAEINGLLSPLNSDPNGERWTQDEPDLSLTPDKISPDPVSPLAKPDEPRAKTSWAATQGRERSSTNPHARPPISTWQSLRNSWWGQSDQQQTSVPVSSDELRPHRAWSFKAHADASEHRSSSPVARISSGSKAEALVQPIFAQADFDDRLTTDSASHRSQPGLLRKLSEQVARSHSPNSAARSRQRDETNTPLHRQTDEDFLLR